MVADAARSNATRRNAQSNNNTNNKNKNNNDNSINLKVYMNLHDTLAIV